MTTHYKAPEVARILLRELGAPDAAVRYAERIARNAGLNGVGDMALQYADAARLIRNRDIK